jgi:hypothetical protein
MRGSWPGILIACCLPACAAWLATTGRARERIAEVCIATVPPLLETIDGRGLTTITRRT